MIIVKIQGGLGNQLFQYATARRLSIINDIPIKLDLNTILNKDYPYKYRLNKFNIVETKAREQEISELKSVTTNKYLSLLFRKIRINNIYNKKTHIIENALMGIDSSIFSSQNSVYLEGWLSNEAYFKDIRNILLDEFTLKKSPEGKYNQILEEIQNCESVALHIRRGDYLQNNYFELLPLSYYYKAIKCINNSIPNPKFYIFSNDIEWVKLNLNILGTYIFIENNPITNSISYTVNDYEDFNLMKNCKHHIIANSTFSWWGAWLNNNPNKKVYSPSIYYRNPKTQKQFEKSSFIPSDWIKINP